MKDIKYLEDLILDYGKAFYGTEGPGYAAKKWVEVLPNADPLTSRSGFTGGSGHRM